MLICPKCNRQFDQALRFCEFDGTPLVSASDRSATDQRGTPRRETDGGRPTSAPDGYNAEYKEFTGSDEPVKRPRKPISRETKAGLGVIVALTLVVVAALYVRAMREFRLDVTFEDGHGLKIGDAVYCMGADIGEVVSAGFDNGRFIASLVTAQSVAGEIRQDSAFFVANDKILLNKKCIHIIVLDPASAPLVAGTTVKGEDSAVKYYFTLLKREGGKEAQRALLEMRSIFDLPGGGFKDMLNGLGG